MKLLVPTSDVAGFRIDRLFVLAFFVQIAGSSTILLGQQQPYSWTPEFQKILSELKRSDVRPSRLSSGELLNKSLPMVPVASRETEEELSLETEDWRLRVKKAPWQFSLTNKRSSAVWQMQTGDSQPSGIWWLQKAANQPARALRLTKIQEIEREGNRWIARGTLDGVLELGCLEITALTSTASGLRHPSD